MSKKIKKNDKNIKKELDLVVGVKNIINNENKQKIYIILSKTIATLIFVPIIIGISIGLSLNNQSDRLELFDEAIGFSTELFLYSLSEKYGKDVSCLNIMTEGEKIYIFSKIVNKLQLYKSDEDFINSFEYIFMKNSKLEEKDYQWLGNMISINRYERKSILGKILFKIHYKIFGNSTYKESLKEGEVFKFRIFSCPKD